MVAVIVREMVSVAVGEGLMENFVVMGFAVQLEIKSSKTIINIRNLAVFIIFLLRKIINQNRYSYLILQDQIAQQLAAMRKIEPKNRGTMEMINVAIIQSGACFVLFRDS
jgi:hypothetical protein